MARTKEEKERRILEAKERAERRRAARAFAKTAALGDDVGGKAGGGGGGGGGEGGRRRGANVVGRGPLPTSVIPDAGTTEGTNNSTVPMIDLPIDALSNVMRYLPAREYGAMMMTCHHVRMSLTNVDCRSMHLFSRLMRGGRGEEEKEAVDVNDKERVVAVGADGNDISSMGGGGGMRFCACRMEAQVRCFFVAL